MTDTYVPELPFQADRSNFGAMLETQEAKIPLYKRRALKKLNWQPKPLELPAQSDLHVSRITKEAIQQELVHLSKKEASNYITQFDYSFPNQSIHEILQSKYQDHHIDLVNTERGFSSSKIVRINGVSKGILKKVLPPETLFTFHWDEVVSHLDLTQGDTLAEKVQILFITYPNQISYSSYPFCNFAQREKLAYVIGEDLGVPYTEVIEASDGIFSLQAFVLNQVMDLDSKEGLSLVNLQDLQDIGILDILTENQDRNADNILMTPCPQFKLVPIDHAMTFQQPLRLCSRSNFSEGFRAPCWLNWEASNQALTELTKNKINRLNAIATLKRAKSLGLVVDQKVRDSLIANVSFLKKAIKSKANINLRSLYRDYSDYMNFNI